RWWAAAGMAAAFGAVLVLAVQTDVIGDPWIGYCLWALAGLTVAPVALTADADRSASGHRARSPEGERPRARDHVLPRRARLRADAAHGRRGSVPLSRRLPPSHRAQHVGVEGRTAAASG